MSLINKVLEDLERSHPITDGAAASDLTVSTRAVVRPRRRANVPVIAGAAGAAGAIGALFFFVGSFTGAAQPPAPQAPAPMLVAKGAPVARAPAMPVSAPAQVASGPASAAIDAKPEPPVVAATPAVVAPSTIVAVATPPREVASRVARPEPPLVVATARAPAASAAAPTRREEPAQVQAIAEPVVARTPPPVKTVSAEQQSDNLYREGVVLTQQGRVAEAAERFTKSLQIEPANIASRRALANIWLQRGNMEAALATLEEGRKVAPDNAELAVGVARLELERGNAQRAQELLEGAIRGGKADASLHALEAVALQRLARHEEAISHFVLALQASPGMPNWLVGLGISLRAAGRDAEASEAFDRALRTGLLAPELAAYVEAQLRSPAR